MLDNNCSDRQKEAPCTRMGEPKVKATVAFKVEEGPSSKLY